MSDAIYSQACGWLDRDTHYAVALAAEMGDFIPGVDEPSTLGEGFLAMGRAARRVADKEIANVDDLRVRAIDKNDQIRAELDALKHAINIQYPEGLRTNG